MSEGLSISERRKHILERIEIAATWAGRSVEDISLVTVSKQQSDIRVSEMLQTEQKIFGENRVQEAQNRWQNTFKEHRQDIELRLIGPLQTNKALEAVSLFDVIETVDREKLVRALVRAADKAGCMPRFYVQVNTGEEEQKSGISPQDLPAFLALIRKDYDLVPEGLMCIPPQNGAPSPHFWLLANLAADHGLKALSMGMSRDFELAVKLGATHIRVGSTAFGARE